MLWGCSSSEQESHSRPEQTWVFSSSLHVYCVRETQDFRGICSHVNFWPNSVRWSCVLRTSCLPHHRQFNLTLIYINCDILLQTPKCLFCKCYPPDPKTSWSGVGWGAMWPSWVKKKVTILAREMPGASCGVVLLEGKAVFLVTSDLFRQAGHVRSKHLSTCLGDKWRTGAMSEETRLQIRDAESKAHGGSWRDGSAAKSFYQSLNSA